MTVIALVGLPGGGKSTVGRQLARRLGVRFVDADSTLEARFGMPIKAYFAEHGEAAFRARGQIVVISGWRCFIESDGRHDAGCEWRWL